MIDGLSDCDSFVINTIMFLELDFVAISEVLDKIMA